MCPQGGQTPCRNKECALRVEDITLSYKNGKRRGVREYMLGIRSRKAGYPHIADKNGAERSRHGRSKGIIVLILAAMMLISLPTAAGPSDDLAGDDILSAAGWDGTATLTFSGGDGSSASPWEIRTASELKLMANNINSDTGNTSSQYYTLKDDIILNDLTHYIIWGDGFVPKNVWAPIGNSTVNFNANFDGDGHSVNGIYINTANSHQGLFGYTGPSAVIENTGVEYSCIKSGTYAGGVVGYNNGGTIAGCYNTSNVTCTGTQVGGVVGYNNGGTITNCYNTGDVTCASFAAGGVVGLNHGGTVADCYNTGNVTGSGTQAGGVVAINRGTVTNCYNTGSVRGTTFVGGVTGYNDTGTVTNCYSAGSVSGGSFVGGVAGENCAGSTISYTYFLKISGSTNSGLNALGTGSGTTVNTYDLNASGQINGTVSGLSLPSSGLNPSLIDALNTWVTSPSHGNSAYSLWTDPPYPVLADTLSAAGNGSIWDGTVAAGFAGGTGTENDPYLIADGQQLAYLRQVINTNAADTVNSGMFNSSAKYYVLVNDIMLNITSDWTNWNIAGPTNTWTPIGTDILPYQFNAKFDGGGHAVKGIYTNNSSNYQGLFGYTGSFAVIKNVGVEQSYIKGGSYAGALAAYADGTMIANCYNKGTVTGTDHAGGLVGANYGTVISCYNTGNVSAGGHCAGGVAGYNSAGGMITNCYNTGNVNGAGNYTGGVAGYSGGTVANCYSTGNITGTGSQVGGVVGCNSDGTVANCYNTGNVTGTGPSVGGVAGENHSSGAEISYTYFLKIGGSTNSGLSAVGLISGGTVTESYDLDDASYQIQGTVGGLSVILSNPDLKDALNAWVSNEKMSGNPQEYFVYTDTTSSPQTSGSNIKTAFLTHVLQSVKIFGTVYDSETIPSALGDVLIGYEVDSNGTILYVSSDASTGYYEIVVPEDSSVTILSMNSQGYVPYPFSQLPINFTSISSDASQDLLMDEGWYLKEGTHAYTYMEWSDDNGTAWNALSGDIPFLSGTEVLLKASSSAANKEFSYWTLNSSAAGNTNPMKIMISSDITVGTVSADASSLSFRTITPDEHINGKITWSLDGTMYFDLEDALSTDAVTVYLKAEGGPGYTFTAWYGDIFGNDHPYVYTAMAPITVSALFYDAGGIIDTDHFTVSSGTANNGKVLWSLSAAAGYSELTGTKTFPAGTTVYLKATADPGYAFTAWGGDLTGTDDPYAYSAGTSMTAGAVFTLIPDTTISESNGNDGDGPMWWVLLPIIGALALVMFVIYRRRS